MSDAPQTPQPPSPSAPRPNPQHRLPQGGNTTGIILPVPAPYGIPAGLSVQPAPPPPDEEDSVWEAIWEGMKKRAEQQVSWDVGEVPPPELTPVGAGQWLGAGLMDAMAAIAENPGGRGGGGRLRLGPSPRPPPKRQGGAAPPPGDGAYVLGDGRNGRCKLKPYSQLRGQCPTGQDAHHVLPDRAFRLGGRRSKERLADAPSMGEGLTICLQSNKEGPQAEHSRAHEFYDDAEKILANDPASAKGLALLEQAEALAAESVEKATDGQCRKEDLQQQLRDHHEKKFGLKKNVQVRATQRLPSAQAKQQMGRTGRRRRGK